MDELKELREEMLKHGATEEQIKKAEEEYTRIQSVSGDLVKIAGMLSNLDYKMFMSTVAVAFEMLSEKENMDLPEMLADFTAMMICANMDDDEE